MKMRERRRHLYRKLAYAIRLREFTTQIEEIANSLLRSELVEIDITGHRNAAAEEARRSSAGVP